MRQAEEIVPAIVSALDQTIADVTSDEERWIRFMLVEEYGLNTTLPSPVRAGLATFMAFLVCGAVPLLPFALNVERAFEVSIDIGVSVCAASRVRLPESTAPGYVRCSGGR